MPVQALAFTSFQNRELNKPLFFINYSVLSILLQLRKRPGTAVNIYVLTRGPENGGDGTLTPQLCACLVQREPVITVWLVTHGAGLLEA